MLTFKVVTREVPHAGRQITADIVGNDGTVVRSGMWPDYANVECALLNEYCANNWTVDEYRAERAIRLANVRVSGN